MNLDLTSSNLSLISNAPLDYDEYEYQLFNTIESVVLVVEDELKQMIDSLDFDLSEIQILKDFKTDLSISKPRFDNGHRTLKSYYVRLYTQKNKLFFTIRVSDHWNSKNPKGLISTQTFKDISGNSDDEVLKSITNAIDDLKNLLIEKRNQLKGIISSLITDILDLC